jgi:hypothetical protein
VIAASVFLLAQPVGACPIEPTSRAATQADAPPYRWFVRELIGGGDAKHLPLDDGVANWEVTGEVGGYPLGRVFATGLSVSYARDFYGHWMVFTPGLFAQINVTALLMSGLFAYDDDPQKVPFRIEWGERLGLGLSKSERPENDFPNSPSYQLWRPEVHSYVDVAVPLGREARHAIVGRGAIDTPVNLASLFRYSFSLGVEFAWEPIP